MILITLLSLLALTLTIVAGSILASRKKEPEPSEIPALTETSAEVSAAIPEPPNTEAPTEVPAESAAETTVPTIAVTPVTESPETAPETTAPRKTLYSTARANVRKGPGVEFPQIGKLEKGSFVEQISESKDKWTEIWFQGQKAYVASEYLTEEKPKFQEPAPTEPMPDSRKVNDAVYSTGSLHVRSGPGKNYKSIGYLKEGQKADRVAIFENGWSKIRYNSGYGYVSNQYLKTEKPASENPVYQDVNETVYATENMNLRSGPGINHKISAKLKAGESIKRVGLGDNGWSEVLFEGSKLYASSEYLTTKKPGSDDKPTEPTTPPETEKPEETAPQKPRPSCKKVDETRVATQDLILYSGPDASYQELGHLSKGSLVHRTGLCDNGWSQILLGGKEVYVVSAYLVEEKKPDSKPAEPSKPTESSEPPASVRDEDGFVINEKTVYVAADDVNVRTAPNTSCEKLGKLMKGTALKRLSVGDIGWTKVLYQGQEAFVKSSLLTEDAPSDSPDKSKMESFRKVDETIYAVDDVLVRTGPGTDCPSLGHLYFADSAQRIGIGDKGWSQILWDDETAYVYSKYVTTEKPEIPDFGETTTPGFPTPNSPFIYQYVDDPDLIPYAIFEPVNPADSDPLPLIISLHGSAEAGKNREYMEGQHLTKVFREWEYTKLDSFDAYVVCPHLAQGTNIWLWQSPEGIDALYKVLDYILDNYDVDKDRIILEGHSMGAQGAFKAAADSRSPFTKLVIGSGYDGGIDYGKIKIPVKGYSGGYETGESFESIKFMLRVFRDYFGENNWYMGPYSHDDVAIRYFQEDQDKNGKSDIIEWMLK